MNLSCMHTSVLHVGVCEESGAELVAWSRTLRAIRFLRFVRVLRWLKLKGVTETFKDPSESTLLFATRVASCSRLPVVYIDASEVSALRSAQRGALSFQHRLLLLQPRQRGPPAPDFESLAGLLLVGDSACKPRHQLGEAGLL